LRTAKAASIVALVVTLAVVCAATAGAVREPPGGDEGGLLASRRLLIPVDGVSRKQLRDNFSEARGGKRRHDALDIMAARGTPVFAVDDGRVAKLFHGGAGGLTIYLFDPGAGPCAAPALHYPQAGARPEMVEGHSREPVPLPHRSEAPAC
jgi:hypothetical protein